MTAYQEIICSSKKIPSDWSHDPVKLIPIHCHSLGFYTGQMGELNEDGVEITKLMVTLISVILPGCSWLCFSILSG